MTKIDRIADDELTELKKLQREFEEFKAMSLKRISDVGYRARNNGADNLIPNAGFESGLITPHLVFDSGSGSVSWSIGDNAANARTDRNYLICDMSSATQGSRFMFRGPEHVRQHHVQVAHGDRYWYHFWVRSASASNANRVRARSEFWNASGHQGGAGTSAFVTPTATWQKVGVETNAALAGLMDWVVFDIEVENTGNPEDFIWFDDVYVTKAFNS